MDERYGFEKSFMFWSAFVLAVSGVVLIYITRFNKTDTWQSMNGALGGVLFWIGAVEYGLIFGSRKLGITSLHGTAPEYRLMKFTWPLLLGIFLYLLFHEDVRCNFIAYLRRKLPLMKGPTSEGRIRNYGPRTAFEMIIVLWTFYVLLLLAYDESIFGVHHPVTYLIFILSLGCGIYLIYKLLKIKEMGKAIRYAIPTAIIFWNGMEILAKWKVFKEPWLTLNVPIMSSIMAAFLITFYLIFKERKRKLPD
ncbi:MAG: hypothetical protein KAV87_35555 [Desulfobacteraceae bacterium]|nr:hypothetical protein [Desulfobacteraceae bacterium]